MLNHNMPSVMYTVKMLTQIEYSIEMHISPNRLVCSTRGLTKKNKMLQIKPPLLNVAIILFLSEGRQCLLTAIAVEEHLYRCTTGKLQHFPPLLLK